MECWKAGRIQRVYNGMLEGRGGSRGFTLVCWRQGDPEGLPWYAGKQGGSGGFTMACWKAGVDPEGLPWYAGRQFTSCKKYNMSFNLEILKLNFLKSHQHFVAVWFYDACCILLLQCGFTSLATTTCDI